MIEAMKVEPRDRLIKLRPMMGERDWHELCAAVERLSSAFCAGAVAQSELNEAMAVWPIKQRRRRPATIRRSGARGRAMVVKAAIASRGIRRGA